MHHYKIGRLKGEFCLVFYDARGQRHRHRLGTADASEAQRLAPAIYAELTRPKGSTVATLWHAYTTDHAGRAIVGTMVHTWKALRDRFGPMEAMSITVEDCRAHVGQRRKFGIKDGTLLTELGHLRMVLRWAEKHRLILRAPYIERPPKPKPKEHHLTKAQARALINSAHMPHLQLYIILALS